MALFGKTRELVLGGFKDVQDKFDRQANNPHLSPEVQSAWRQALNCVDNLVNTTRGYLESLERNVLETVAKRD